MDWIWYGKQKMLSGGNLNHSEVFHWAPEYSKIYIRKIHNECTQLRKTKLYQTSFSMRHTSRSSYRFGENEKCPLNLFILLQLFLGLSQEKRQVCRQTNLVKMQSFFSFKENKFWMESPDACIENGSSMIFNPEIESIKKRTDFSDFSIENSQTAWKQSLWPHFAWKVCLSKRFFSDTPIIIINFRKLPLFPM